MSLLGALCFTVMRTGYTPEQMEVLDEARLELVRVEQRDPTRCGLIGSCFGALVGYAAARLTMGSGRSAPPSYNYIPDPDLKSSPRLIVSNVIRHRHPADQRPFLANVADTRQLAWVEGFLPDDHNEPGDFGDSWSSSLG